MWRGNSQPATGCGSLAGSLYRIAQPGTHRLVRATPYNPLKRAPRSTITYLEKPEMDALWTRQTDPRDQGRRDHVLLLFLYNTGARADEAAQTKDLRTGAGSCATGPLPRPGPRKRQQAAPLSVLAANRFESSHR